MSPLTLQSHRPGAETLCMMTVSDLRIYETATTTVPRGYRVGLWSKLTAEFSRSAAGSGLTGSGGPGQPISSSEFGHGSGMFGYDAEQAVATDGTLPF